MNCVIIGLERSNQSDIRSGTDISNIPKHLLIAESFDWCGETKWVYKKYKHRNHDTISFADIDNISCNKVKVFTVQAEKLHDFESQYNIKVKVPRNTDK